MIRPVGREILLAQNDFMCQIFGKIDADQRRGDCAKWFAMVNGRAV